MYISNNHFTWCKWPIFIFSIEDYHHLVRGSVSPSKYVRHLVQTEKSHSLRAMPTFRRNILCPRNKIVPCLALMQFSQERVTFLRWLWLTSQTAKEGEERPWLKFTAPVPLYLRFSDEYPLVVRISSRWWSKRRLQFWKVWESYCSIRITSSR